MEMQDNFVRECIWTINEVMVSFFRVVALYTFFLCHFFLYTIDMHLVVRACELSIFTCSLFFLGCFLADQSRVQCTFCS